MFLRNFFRFFTNLSDNECFDKLKQNKKIPKRSLITSNNVSSVRKGIDCLHNINHAEIDEFFYKNAHDQLHKLISIFNESPFFVQNAKQN